MNTAQTRPIATFWSVFITLLGAGVLLAPRVSQAVTMQPVTTRPFLFSDPGDKADIKARLAQFPEGGLRDAALENLIAIASLNNPAHETGLETDAVSGTMSNIEQ